MKFIADLQLHSKYSRATSKEMDLPVLDKWGEIKGIQVLGTGDFTHPAWFSQLGRELEPAEPGLFVFKNSPNKKTRFLLSAEVSLIYSKNDRQRRVHHVILAPDLKTVKAINTRLSWVGKLASDGRPIIGMSSEELAKIVFEVSDQAMIIPAHAWTSWYSIFGSKSGFDSVEECFGPWTKNIFAIETGLSSDPAMNWRLSQLDGYTLVSNSDAHSPPKLGREANVFDTDLSYQAIFATIKSGDPEKFLYTIEFYPEEGKYHYDGHRVCKVRWSPKETKKHSGVCARCKRRVTIGVLSRVEELADRPEGFQPEGRVPFKRIVPLEEIIAEVLGVRPGAKSVREVYFKLCRELGGELKILLESSPEQIRLLAPAMVAEGVLRVREGRLNIEPGYDGEYGEVKIFSPQERRGISPQKALF